MESMKQTHEEQLLEAARTNDLTSLQSLLATNPHPSTDVISAAAITGSTEAVDMLLPHYPAEGTERATALFNVVSHAIQNRQLPLLRYAVEQHGAPIYSDDSRGMYAAENVDADTLRYLASRGFSVNDSYSSHGGGILDRAILAKAPPSFIKFLLEELHADPNVGKDFVGHGTALRMAAHMDRTPELSTLRLLLDAGATTEDSDALHDAAYGGNVGAVRLLLEKGADVNQVVEEASGEAPLMAAVRSFDHVQPEAASNIMRMLLQKGADANMMQASGFLQGKSALDVAQAEGYTQAVEILRSFRT